MPLNPLHPANASYEIVVIFAGIVNASENPLQSQNALLSTDSKFSGRFNLPVNDDLENAALLIVVIVAGRLSGPVKRAPLNARCPIETRFAGRVNVPVHQRFEKVWSSMIVISVGRIKSPVNPEQPENADPSIVVTVFGMVNLPSNPAHSINAWKPIVVTPSGIVKSP